MLVPGFALVYVGVRRLLFKLVTCYLLYAVRRGCGGEARGNEESERRFAGRRGQRPHRLWPALQTRPVGTRLARTCRAPGCARRAPAATRRDAPGGVSKGKRAVSIIGPFILLDGPGGGNSARRVPQPDAARPLHAFCCHNPFSHNERRGASLKATAPGGWRLCRERRPRYNEVTSSEMKSPLLSALHVVFHLPSTDEQLTSNRRFAYENRIFLRRYRITFSSRRFDAWRSQWRCSRPR